MCCNCSGLHALHNQRTMMSPQCVHRCCIEFQHSTESQALQMRKVRFKVTLWLRMLSASNGFTILLYINVSTAVLCGMLPNTQYIQITNCFRMQAKKKSGGKASGASTAKASGSSTGRGRGSGGRASGGRGAGRGRGK